MASKTEYFFDYRTCGLCPYRTKSITVMCEHEAHHRKRTKLDLFSCEENTLLAYKCPYCKFFETETKVVLNNHIKVIHNHLEDRHNLTNLLKMMICEKCQLQTYSLLILLGHACDPNCKNEQLLLSQNEVVGWTPGWELVDGVKWYKCDHCSHRTKGKQNLKVHHMFKHATGFEWFECDRCEYKSKMKTYLKRHVKCCHEEVLQWFRCKHCRFRTKEREKFKSHTDEMHPAVDIHWFECDRCGFSALSRGGLKNHVNMRHK